MFLGFQVLCFLGDLEKQVLRLSVFWRCIRLIRLIRLIWFIRLIRLIWLIQLIDKSKLPLQFCFGADGVEHKRCTSIKTSDLMYVQAAPLRKLSLPTASTPTKTKVISSCLMVTTSRCAVGRAGRPMPTQQKSTQELRIVYSRRSGKKNAEMHSPTDSERIRERDREKER